jgi:hypothetical protein
MLNRCKPLGLAFALAGSLSAKNLEPVLTFGGQSPLAGDQPVSRMNSNSVVDILPVGDAIWTATGEGLSVTNDNGATWTHFSTPEGIGHGSATALATFGGRIWAATAFDTTTALGSFDAGGGIGWTSDGHSWHWFPQPVDSRDESRYKPTTTNVQNLIYDIAIVPSETDTTVWIASFGGGLRKSTDLGQTWTVVTVDGLPFDALTYLTHRMFSVHFDGRALWAGSAGGIHRSLDYGKTWTTFTHQNQTEGISGNFVVAIGHHEVDGRTVIWAATVEALDSSEVRAVSVTLDNGLTWRTTLQGEFAHNFGFDGETVYAATDDGVYKSSDLGLTWARFPAITDAITGESLLTTEMAAVAAIPSRSVWFGSMDGLAASFDDGRSWKIFHAFETPGGPTAPETYAYPNPFSPLRQGVTESGDGHVRFQYHLTQSGRVTAEVFDFGMNAVATVVRDRYRSAGDFSEVWNGKNDFGDMVANGVYFYRITIDGSKTLWGKVMVIN